MTRSLLILMVMLFGSCRSIQYVPVETVRTDSLYLNKIEIDSVIVHDSVYIREANDTVFLYKYKYKYRTTIRADTVYVERTDSVRVPYPVPAQLTRWQQTKLNIGTGLLIIFGIGIPLGVIIIYIRKK